MYEPESKLIQPSNIHLRLAYMDTFPILSQMKFINNNEKLHLENGT